MQLFNLVPCGNQEYKIVVPNNYPQCLIAEGAKTLITEDGELIPRLQLAFHTLIEEKIQFDELCYLDLEKYLLAFLLNIEFSCPKEIMKKDAKFLKIIN